MKSTFPLLSFLCLLTITSNAQSFYQSSYGDSLNDFGIATIKNSSGGYCMLSRNESADPLSADLVIYGLDDEGSILWSSKIGTDKGDYPTDIKQTADGGFIICGYSYGGFIDTLTTDIFLLKIDDQGFPMWSNTYGGSLDERASSVLVNDDGGFFVAGTTYSFGNAPVSALLMRTDDQGNPLWTTVTSTKLYNNYSSICFDQQHNIICAGTANNSTERSQYISIIDTAGFVLSNTTTDATAAGFYKPIINALYTASNGDFITVGSATDNGNSTCNVVRRTSGGNIIWNKNFSGFTAGNSIVEDVQNNFHIACFVTAGGGPGNDAAYLLSIDPSGNLLYVNNYGDLASSTNLVHITSASTDRILATGTTAGESYLVKADLSGNSGCYQQVSTTNVTDPVYADSIGVDDNRVALVYFQTPMNWQFFSNQFSRYCFDDAISENDPASQALIYPTIGTGIFNIKMNNSAQHQLSIFNGFGQKVMQSSFGQIFDNVDLTNMSDGVYFIQIDGQFAGKFFKAGSK
jgi:hypothetical protein